MIRFLCALLMVPAVSSAEQVTFSDGTLSDADWSYTQIKTPEAVGADKPDGASGDPAPSRRITTSFPFNSDPIDIVFLVALRNNAIIDPGMTVGIISVDYSESGRCTSGCGVNGQSTSPALKQGDNIFFLQRLGTGPTSTAWSDISAPGLAAEDFSLILGASAPFFDHSTDPDFSASGAPIQAGYLRSNSGPGAFSSDGGLDNWEITFHTPPSPTIPGSFLTTFTTLQSPFKLSFGASGELYAGHGENTVPVPIHRVSPGGAPVTSFGPNLPDPDAVAFDAVGFISGTPGSVLVGGDDGSGPGAAGYISAILPDQSVVSLVNSTTTDNPQSMKFLPDGRLVVGDHDSENVYTVDRPGGGAIVVSVLFSLPISTFANGIAVDGGGQIYAGLSDGQVRIYDSSGSAVDLGFANLGSAVDDLVLGPDTGGWDGDLFAVSSPGGAGKLFRIDISTGAVSEVASGFSSPRGLAFGPDGALYIADGAGWISRLTLPAAVPALRMPALLVLAALMVIGTWALFRSAVRRAQC